MSDGPYPGALQRFPTIRQSRGVAFDACALSAKFDMEYRADWSGHPQVRGQIMHRVFAEALRWMYQQEETKIPTGEIIAILRNALRQNDVDRECPECGGVVVEHHQGRIRCARGHEFRADFGNIPMSEIKDMRWVAVKWAFDNEFDIQNLVDIEKRLSATVSYPDGQGGHVDRSLTGQLDALFLAGDDDEEAVVWDWKDTFALPGPADLGFDGYAQQRWYAWLVLRNYPAIRRVRLREFYVRFSTPREAVLYRGDEEEVEAELSALVERFDRAVEQDTYPPSPGRHCMMCARPAACPIFPGVRRAGAITDEETAGRYADQAIAAKAVLKQHQEALKAWASVRGPIAVNATPGRERVWGFRESKRTSRPSRDQVERALLLHGSNVKLDDLFKQETVTRFDEFRPVLVEDEPDDAGLLNALTESLEERPEA